MDRRSIGEHGDGVFRVSGMSCDRNRKSGAEAGTKDKAATRFRMVRRSPKTDIVDL